MITYFSEKSEKSEKSIQKVCLDNGMSCFYRYTNVLGWVFGWVWV